MQNHDRRTGKRNHDLKVGDAVEIDDAYDNPVGRIIKRVDDVCVVELESGEVVNRTVFSVFLRPSAEDIAKLTAQFRAKWTPAQEKKANNYPTEEVGPHSWPGVDFHFPDSV